MTLTNKTLQPSRQSAIEPGLAHWLDAQQRSILRQMVTLVSQPGIVSMAGGLPDPALFPAAELAQSYARVLTEDPRALQYGPPVERLEEHIVRLMARRGVVCSSDQVFLTTGAQQALSVLARLFLNPGGTVALEQFVYTGARQAASPRQPQVLQIPSDLETGLDVEVLERALMKGRRPAYLYVIPDAHNPLGVSLSSEKRYRLVELAHRFGLPIIEDDPYGLLSYDGEFDDPLRALDAEWVFAVGSFSKIIAPALRLGWMVVPERFMEKVSIVKEALDLECSALTQRVVVDYLDRVDFEARLSRLREVYRGRRDAMIDALERHLPDEARFSRPGGGMFVWAELPGSVDTRRLVETTVERHKVAFVPGAAFASDPTEPQGGLRLSFSTLEPQQIESAVEALASCL